MIDRQAQTPAHRSPHRRQAGGRRPSRDHFHPFYGGTPPERPRMMVGPMVWDGAKDETKEIKPKAFGDGANHAYADGHAKFGKWSQLWWRDLPNGVCAGSFDLHNAGRPN